MAVFYEVDPITGERRPRLTPPVWDAPEPVRHLPPPVYSAEPEYQPGTLPPPVYSYEPDPPMSAPVAQPAPMPPPPLPPPPPVYREPAPAPPPYVPITPEPEMPESAPPRPTVMPRPAAYEPPEPPQVPVSPLPEYEPPYTPPPVARPPAPAPMRPAPTEPVSTPLRRLPGMAAPPQDVPATPAVRPRDVLSLGLTQVGKPYVWGGGRGEDISGFDCSGFVSWVYKQVGKEVPAFTDAAYDATEPIQGEPRPGDIVFFQDRDPSQPGVRFPHMGLYAGGGQMIDAAGGSGVGVHPLRSNAVFRRVKGSDEAEAMEPGPAETGNAVQAPVTFRTLSAARPPVAPPEPLPGDPEPQGSAPMFPDLDATLGPSPEAPPMPDYLGGLLAPLQAVEHAIAETPIGQAYQAVSEPFAGAMTLGQKLAAAEASGDPSIYQQLEGRGVVPGAGRDRALEEAQYQYDKEPLPFVTGVFQEALNPLTYIGPGEVAGAGRAVRTVGREAVEQVGRRLTGIDPATGRRYATQGGLDLAGAGDDASRMAKQPWEMTRGDYESDALLHGTPRQFDTFEAAPYGKTAFGIFFTKDPDVAEYYATGYTGRTVKARPTFAEHEFADLTAPSTFEAVLQDSWLPEDIWDDVRVSHENGTLYNDSMGRWQNELLQQAQRMGYKGARFYDTTAGKLDISYAVFDPQDIELLNHRAVVEQALAEGKHVPPQVLAEYPDLVASMPPPVRPGSLLDPPTDQLDRYGELDTLVTRWAETLGMSVGMPPPPSRIDPPTPDHPSRVMPSPTAENVLGLREISPGLTRRDQIANSFKATLGIRTATDDFATPAFRERARLQQVVDSQSAALAAQADERVRRVFAFDKEGRIPALADDAAGFPAGPTVQDVAARLPVFAERLTDEQGQAFVWLQNSLAPYRQLWDEVGGRELHNRADVMEGGFYLPRGRADVEGLDAPAQAYTGPTRRGKAGFEKSAVFDSQAQGIGEGFKYASLHDAVQSYVKDAGSRIADRHTANFLIAATDDAGKPLASTMADRIDPKLRTEITVLRAKIHARRVALTRQNVREQMAGKSVDQAERIAARAQTLMDGVQARFEERLAGQNTDAHVVAAERELRVLQAAEARADRTFANTMNRKMESRALNQIAIRDYRAAEAATARAEAAKVRYEAAVAKNRPDAVTKAAQREYQVRAQEAQKAETRAQASRSRADAYTSKRESTEAELNRLTDEMNALKGRWQQAQERARQTPRGMGQVGMVELQGYAFPDALASAANNVLTNEGRLSGKGSTPLRVVNAVNNLYRGVRATADDSALFIQGLLGLAKDQKAYGEALKVNFKAWGNQGDRALGEFLVEFDNAAVEAGLPTASEWARAGLHVGGSETEFTVATGLGGIMKKIQNAPILRQSNRAFGYFGDTLRLRWAQDELAGMLRSGRTLDEVAVSGDLASIAKAVNGATGWSPEKFATDFGELLMFAPRYFQSRLDTLGRAVAGLRPGAAVDQRIARDSLLKLIAGGTAITYLANWSRGHDTDARPAIQDERGNWRRNPNFMRIRDIAGQDISVFGPWDSLLGAFITTATGDPARAVRILSSGSVQQMWDFFSEKDGMGRPVRDTPQHFAEWLARSWTPFQTEPIVKAVGQAAEGVQAGDAEQVAGAGLGVALNTVGIKATEQSYSDVREAIALSRYQKHWEDLNQAQRRDVREAQELTIRQAKMLPQEMGTPEERAAYSFQRAAEVKTDLEKQLRAHIDAGMMGKELREKVGQFKRDRYMVNKTLLDTPEVQEQMQRDKKPLEDLLADEYWGVPLPEDLRTGELDYNEQEKGQLDVLQRAQAAGISLNYIKGIGSGTWRGKRFTDPVVRATVEADEKDKETLREYWSVGDKFQQRNPAYKRAVERVKALPEGSAERQAQEDDVNYRLYLRDVGDERARLRRNKAEIQAAGVRLEYWESTPKAVPGDRPDRPERPERPLPPLPPRPAR